MNILIIGNGVAGVSAAEAIRAADKGCGITMVSDEPYPFYARPRLIELLAGRASIEQITLHAQAWYKKNSIMLSASTRIARMDTEAKRIFSAEGSAFSYDKLVIASGASCILPQVPGMSGDRIATLRTIDDALRIRALAAKGRTAVVIGGGLLGIEAANSLLSRGLQVRVMEVCGRLLPRQLDRESSAVLQKLLEEKGLTFSIGRLIRRIDHDAGSGLRIVCDDGKETAADFALVSAGISPNLSFCEGTPLKRDRGIVTNDLLRTSVPDVYACGDAAEHRGKVYGLWQPAREQGIACGSHIAGKETPYAGTLSSVRLKVAGIELASIGDIAREGDRAVTENNGPSGAFRKLFLRGDRIVGAVLIGNAGEAVKLQQMIRTGERYPA